MVLIITFIIFLSIFILVVDFFAILFTLTGMPIEKARFQVVSLLTSTGFTTRESETIVQHPIRRKLARALMIFSYGSTVTFISFIVNLISNSLINPKSTFMLVIFLIFATIFLKSSLMSNIEHVIENSVEHSRLWKRFNRKYFNIITKHKGYGICEIHLNESSYLIGKAIKESGLRSKEIEVLSIDKGNDLINFPCESYVFEEDDKITVYGNIKNIYKEI